MKIGKFFLVYESVFIAYYILLRFNCIPKSNELFVLILLVLSVVSIIVVIREGVALYRNNTRKMLSNIAIIMLFTIIVLAWGIKEMWTLFI